MKEVKSDMKANTCSNNCFEGRGKKTTSAWIYKLGWKQNGTTTNKKICDWKFIFYFIISRHFKSLKLYQCIYS